MKRYIFSVLSACLLGACTVEVPGSGNGDGPEGLAIKVYEPTKILAGEVVTISGVDLDKVTSVEFADKSVTEFEIVSNGMIRVVAPTGVSAGELSVVGDGQKATAAVAMTIGAPAIATIAPNDRAAGVGELLTMTGKDLEFVRKAVFPAEGDATIEVSALRMVRKSTGAVLVRVPSGVVSGIAPIRLVLCDGSTIASAEIELSADAAAGYVFPGVLEGVWQWDTNSGWGGGGVWGGGGYLSDYASTWGPAAVGDWFDANYPALFPAEYSAAGEGLQAARMVFAGETMSKIRANGDVVAGTYSVDWTKTKMNANGDAPWSIGELAVKDVTPLFGVYTYSTPAFEPMAYDIVKYTGTQMVLAAAPEGTEAWGSAIFWAFSRVGSTVSSLPADLDLTQGQAITFSGIDLSGYWIDPDWFLPIEGDDKSFVFLAADGQYRIIDDAARKYLRVEVLDGNGVVATTQPDGSGAIWIIGDGNIGKPSFASNPVNWDPSKGLAMTPLGGNKYRITLKAGEQIPTNAINFKPFYAPAWAGEFTSAKIVNNAAAIVSINPGPTDDGNWGLVKALKSGVSYQFILDAESDAKATLTVIEIPAE